MSNSFWICPAKVALTGLLVALGGAFAQPRLIAPLPPTELRGLSYTNEFFPGTTYRATVPTQQSLVGFAAGQRAATASEVEQCLKAWAAAAPDRTRLVEYARSHEKRPLYYMVVTAPTNLARLDEIQAGLAKLGDPRQLADAQAQELIKSLPAVAWLAYTIHGDETEGSDAALAVLYHLVAAEDTAVGKLLAEVVVIVDPLMNPDGRDRFVKMVAEDRGAAPTVDDQSLLHEGYWPRGRGNHYLFDLNRDCIYGVHPETRGRLREVARWNPVLFVDAHGMGAQETHLFSPPREPINPHIPKGREQWSQVFVKDQAAAFDTHHLLYYHGEWNEEWYPGYSDGWASYRGAVGILYEQARIAEAGVRRPEGRILSYGESVHHHVIGSMANLGTVQNHAKELLGYFYNTRKTAVDPNGPYARRTFAVLPSANQSRLGDFVDLMRLQGFEVFSAGREFTAASATDQLGREVKGKTIPAGALLIANRQPLAHLLAAMLEFDPKLSQAVLADEREELLRKGRTRIYDTTAWNLTMTYGLESLTLPTELPEAAQPYEGQKAPAKGLAGKVQSPVAYVINGADDRSVAAAARLRERGIEVRIAEKPFRFDEQDFARGSVVVTRLDNRSCVGDLRQTVAATVEELGLAAVAIGSGLGAGDLPDLGGAYFHRLPAPCIALLSRGSFSASDFGSLWFTLDHELGIRHSHLEEGERIDLSRYNVVVLPGRSGQPLSPALVSNLKDWVKAGGTLIAIGQSAAALAAEKAEFSKVRTLPEVLGRLADYELAVFREWLARAGDLPATNQVWAHKATPGLQYPWQAVDGAHPEEKELKKRDAWQAIFMPEGAFLAARLDAKHWLTAGCAEPLPLLVGRHPVLMAAEGVEVPIRYGYLTPAEKAPPPEKPLTAAAASEPKPKPESTGDRKDADKKEPDKKDKKEPPRIGWCALPPGVEMHLRMSGLLWPEATHRLANAAWVTRESYGRGQVILFATSPTFRGAMRAETRVFLNAAIYGPGFGATQPIKP